MSPLTFPTSTGSPVGNIRLGRRFNEEELRRLLAGEALEAILAGASRPPTREEMYAALFGG